jgi:hypothetical protein
VIAKAGEVRRGGMRKSGLEDHPEVGNGMVDREAEKVLEAP